MCVPQGPPTQGTKMNQDHVCATRPTDPGYQNGPRPCVCHKAHRPRVPKWTKTMCVPQGPPTQGTKMDQDHVCATRPMTQGTKMDQD